MQIAFQPDQFDLYDKLDHDNPIIIGWVWLSLS